MAAKCPARSNLGQKLADAAASVNALRVRLGEAERKQARPEVIDNIRMSLQFAREEALNARKSYIAHVARHRCFIKSETAAPVE